ISKLSFPRRPLLIAEVPASNHPGQVFLWKKSFRVEAALWQDPDACSQDLFRMAYRLKDSIGGGSSDSTAAGADGPPSQEGPVTDDPPASGSAESGPEAWRAVAVFDDRPDRLLCLGRSSGKVRAKFPGVYLEVLDQEERAHVRSISLQKWRGTHTLG